MVAHPPCPPLLLDRRAVTLGLAASAIGLGSVRAQTPGPGPGVTWTARPLRLKLRPDAPAEAELWTFDGAKPGPVLRVRHGEEVRLRLVNETPKPLTLHWHGVRGPNGMDGVGGLTQAPVAPGQAFDYRFTPPDSGTFLIRPGQIGGTAEAAERGLTGLLIVEEATPPRVDQDVLLLVDDWRLAEDGSLAPFGAPESAAGRLGNLLTAGGTPVPHRIEAPPGSRLRIRLANACNARSMRLTFEGLKPYVAAIDGQPTDTFEPLKASVPFAPGTRYDFLLDVPTEPGATGRIVATIGQGVPLATVTAVGAPRDAPPPIAPLAPNKSLPAAIRLQAAARRDLVIRGDGRDPFTLNGAAGSAAKPLLSVKRGQPVVLALKNETPLVQPFHLHGHVFRLLHPYDDGWEPYFLDTVQVPENRTLRIAFNAENPGKWLIGSTVLERLDAGLWTWIDVT